MEACFLSSNCITKTTELIPLAKSKLLVLPKKSSLLHSYKHVTSSSITCCQMGSSSSRDEEINPTLSGDWRSFRAKLVAAEKISIPENPTPPPPASADVDPQKQIIGDNWAHAIHEPEKGCLLIATEKLDGVHIFERTVVLMLATGPIGPTGIILNRPSLMSIKETKSTVLDSSGTFLDRPLYFGGPLEEGLFLVKSPKEGDDGVSKSGVFDEVMKGLYYGTKESVGCAAEMVKRNVIGLDDIKFFDGYCGWEKEQLHFLSSTAIPNLQWVSGIIDKEKRDWRNDIIDGYFNARDRRSILAIPISESDQKDELCWAFSMTGNYTVKSAYMLGKGGDFDTFHQAWVELWKANVIPKVKHFFWRLCTGTLPTRSLLLHRHMIEDAQCSWCGATLETPAHALVDCPRVKDLWSKCKCDQMADWSSYTSICELVASWKSLDSKVKQRGMFLAWCIWGERNRKVFENKITPNEILTHRVFRYVEDLEKYAVRVHKAVNPSPLRSPTKWLAPPCDIVKINTDASLVTEGWVGLGIVARTHEGKVLWTAARRTQAFWAPEIAEAKGILRALKLASGHRDIILESDCKLLIDRLSKGARHSADLDTVLGDILFLCTQFNSVTWSHVRRDGNCVAHCLAKLVPHGVEQIWENSYPNEIAPYVLMDSLSL